MVNAFSYEKKMKARLEDDLYNYLLGLHLMGNNCFKNDYLCYLLSTTIQKIEINFSNFDFLKLNFLEICLENFILNLFNQCIVMIPFKNPGINYYCNYYYYNYYSYSPNRTLHCSYINLMYFIDLILELL